jgi:hypothetical protein
MPSDKLPTGESSPPRRRVRVLILRLGILGVFVIALVLSVVSFALFGCACNRIARYEPNDQPQNPPEDAVAPKPPVPPSPP